MTGVVTKSQLLIVEVHLPSQHCGCCGREAQRKTQFAVPLDVIYGDVGSLRCAAHALPWVQMVSELVSI